MKFYESGDCSKPVIFLFPGTCCLYSSFDHILDRLHFYFYTVTVSYDGFDPNEKTEFYSMEDECEKSEQEIKKKYDGRIKAAYGCSLGGSFVSLLIQRKRIHIDHGIIGSSDMDEAGQFMAKIQSSVVVPIMYKMVHTGKLPKFMQKKINEADKSKKEMIDGFLNMFGIEQGGNPWITKTSVYKGYKRDKIEMRGDRAEMSDFPLYLNTVAGGLDRRDQTIGGFSFVVKIYAVPVVEIIG